MRWKRSEDDEERLAIERGIRAIVTFQERVGEEPIKRKISKTEKVLSPSLNDENEAGLPLQNENKLLRRGSGDTQHAHGYVSGMV